MHFLTSPWKKEPGQTKLKLNDVKLDFYLLYKEG